MTTLDHPTSLAREMARLLDSDPVAASQIQEFLTPERLVEVLRLPSAIHPEDPDEVELRLEGFSDEAILRFISRRFSRSEVLGAF